VPDVLVERIVDSLDCATELFNISVKSGHTITERDHSQLKYELLPVLLKQEVALVMIICAGEAYLEKEFVLPCSSRNFGFLTAPGLSSRHFLFGLSSGFFGDVFTLLLGESYKGWKYINFTHGSSPHASN
jgi:hypothetical protein